MAVRLLLNCAVSYISTYVVTQQHLVNTKCLLFFIKVS